MPKVQPNPTLHQAIEALVVTCGGNESEAARRLGVSRLKVNRIRKSGGGATPAVQAEFWKKLEAQSSSNRGAKNDTTGQQLIQIVQDVPGVALQVLRYIAGIIERDMDSKGQSHAN